MQDKSLNGYPVAFMEQLKDKCDIVNTISKYLPLSKKGKTYWACCPFHSEKTPSFAVNEIEQYYHCFGCGESGDVIKFLEKYDNINFVEAVKKLADSAGLKVPAFSGDDKLIEQAKIKDKLYAACNLAMEYYISTFNKPAAKLAQEYAKKRGLTPAIVQKFKIGYSDGWTGLIDFLKSKNITAEIMKEAGLINQKENSSYDVMAKRLIFPIINVYGDCIGFTARDMEGGFAKYLNTADTPIFNKGRAVYNINNIKLLKQKGGISRIYVCEGQMDVIAMVRAGVENAAACMGTGITVYHAKEIKKFTDKVVLCMDSDEAGQKGAYRTVDIMREGGLNVSVAVLDGAKDPDEFLEKFGAEKLKQQLENAADGIEFKIKYVAGKYNLALSGDKNLFFKEVKPIIEALTGDAEKDIYLKIISTLMNVPVDILRRDLLKQDAAPVVQGAEKAEEFREQAGQKALKFVLASLLHKKEYADLNADYKLSFTNKNYQNLYDYILDCTKSSKVYTISSIFDLFDVANNEDIKALIDFNFDGFSGGGEVYFKESLEKLYESSLKARQEALTKAFKEETDIDKRRAIANELGLVTKELKNKKAEN